VRSTGMLFRWFSIAIMLATAILVLFELVSYSREQTRIPRGVTIAGLSAGGLTSQEAMQMLLQVYSQPVEVHYNKSIFYILPSQVGFTLDTTSMLAAVDAYETLLPSWEGFWSFLWNSPPDAHSIPIKAEYSRTQLADLMEDIAARYDLPPVPPQPEPGRPFFKAGTPGTVLDQEHGAELIVDALFSPDDRRVDLPVVSNQRSLPSLESLDTLIKQLTAVNNYYGLIDVYMVNLQTGQDLHVIHMSGEDFPGEPDVPLPPSAR
jgi:hypothetical protein